MDPSAVLAALADLAPASRERVLDVVRSRLVVWLRQPWQVPLTYGRRFAAIDVLHRDERLLRRGWGFLIGSIEVGGVMRQVRLPLASEPVRLHRWGQVFGVFSVGDLEVTPLIEDAGLVADLELEAAAAIEAWLKGRRRTRADLGPDGWISRAADALGLPLTEVLARAANRGPLKPPVPERGVIGVAWAGLYMASDVLGVSIRNTLRDWARRDGLAQTALAAVYREAPPQSAPDSREVLSPLPLNRDQVEVVRRARDQPLTVVSGPPGNGKSHAVVATALDAVARGGSVLVATQSSHAVDVLGALFDRYPGPTPVLFGDAEQREAIATTLAEGIGSGYGSAALAADERAVLEAMERVRLLESSVDAALELERTAAELVDWEPLLPSLRSEAPRAFENGADLSGPQRLAERAAGPVDTWWRRWRRASAQRRLRARLGAGPAVPLSRLRAAIEVARASRVAARLAADGGTDLGPLWQALRQAESALADAVGLAMRHRAASARRWTGNARSSAAALAHALRAGRSRRRRLLADLDGSALVRALPLWVGTATDIEDLLPPVPGMFELAILDEASHLDQLRAAPVLARARRALIVGDPRQLRFVSFVADLDVEETLRRHQLDGRVDVRRVSAFDLAAGAAPVIWLEEHYRSAPHLIEFSARRFYAGRISVATRHPANDSLDTIEVVHSGQEVDAALAVVHKLAAAGATSIAVLSPFRKHAEALEEALLAAFPVEELERLGLRAGTVHAFQGSEAGTVVACLGLTDADSAARFRFAADPQLFNVLVTRARERMVVVTGLTAPDGIIGEYLTFAEHPPKAPEPAVPDHPWTVALAVELRRAGLTVRYDYPVGRWTVDLCAGDGADATGLVTRVHPDGPAAHRERQRSLDRAGWRLLDAFASRWNADPVPAALGMAVTRDEAAG
jgi:hypothetical protein